MLNRPGLQAFRSGVNEIGLTYLYNKASKVALA